MPRGIFVRTEEHNRKVSEGLLKHHRKKRIDEEQKDKRVFEEKGGHGLQIKNLDREELLDKLAETRIEIDRRIRILGGDFKALSDLQNLEERIETRLEATGMRLKGMGYHKD